MPRLTDTQSIILSRAATRPGNLALPLPKGLAGAAAKKVVSMLIERGWLDGVNRRTCDPSNFSMDSREQVFCPAKESN